MADERIQYTEEMVGNGHPTKADTLNRFGNVEHDTDGTHQKAISHLTASRAVLTDGSKKLVSDEAATGTGAPVRANSCTLIGPNLGTPASGTLTNCTGYPETAITGYPIHEIEELCGVD